MQDLWNKLSLRLKLFLSFGVMFTLMTLLLLVVQSNMYKQDVIDRVMERELPTRLAGLGAEIALELAPSLHLSASLANNSFLENWIAQGKPEASRRDVIKELAQIYQQLNLASVFFAVNELPIQGNHSITYYHYDGVLNSVDLLQRRQDYQWYFDYLDTLKPYELNLDSNEFTDGKLRMYINYSGRSINSAGEPLIVAGIGIDLEQLSSLINNFKVGSSGGASLVTAAGVVEIAGSNTLINDYSSPQMQELLNQHSETITLIEHENEKLFLGLTWVEDLERFLVVEIPMSSYMAPIYSQLYKSLLICCLLIVFALLIFYPLATSLSMPLLNFQKQLNLITQNLDLSQRLTTNDKAELGNLAGQTNSLLAKLESIINAILEDSYELNEAAQKLALTAGLVNKNTNKQQEVSHSMAAAVEQMSSSVAEITSTMEELSASSTQIADHSQAVVDVANITLDSSKKGSEAMQRLQQHITEINQDSVNNLEIIVQLGSKSKEISKVMDIINNVADQTKLIAFNAALEASSAGESGKRFSVVASEIRRLADSVTDSTHEIEARVQEIQDSISRLVVTSEQGATTIQQGLQVSQETASDLDMLVQAASKTSNAAQQISLSTKQQKTASSQVVIALHDIANASSHNAQAVRSITEISETMIDMATSLNELVSEFNYCQLQEKQEQPHNKQAATAPNANS